MDILNHVVNYNIMCSQFNLAPVLGLGLGLLI